MGCELWLDGPTKLRACPPPPLFDMKISSCGLAAVMVGLALAGSSCSRFEAAGSLGQVLHGDTRLRPTPKNYRHVPPRDQDRTPTPMQWALRF